MFENPKIEYYKQKNKLNQKIALKVAVCKTKSNIKQCSTCEDFHFCTIRRFEA
jgi:hypothetical protein